jgi:hypothetical protein
MSKRGYQAVVEKELYITQKGKLYSNAVMKESEGGSTRPLRMEKMMSLPLLCNLVRLSRGE